MSFKSYVARANPSVKFERDFIEDARLDDAMPDVSSWDELEAYLSECRACGEAIQAGKAVWARYQRTIAYAPERAGGP